MADEHPRESEAELGAVTKLVVAYSRILAKDLAEASDGPRVFLIITAPSMRGGECLVMGNVDDEEIDRFLEFVLKHQGTTTREIFELEG
jgi:hypothetical protein